MSVNLFYEMGEVYAFQLAYNATSAALLYKLSRHMRCNAIPDQWLIATNADVVADSARSYQRAANRARLRCQQLAAEMREDDRGDFLQGLRDHQAIGMYEGLHGTSASRDAYRAEVVAIPGTWEG